MTDLSPNLVALATACGVATEYWDWRGEYVAVPESTVVAVLEALGWDATRFGERSVTRSPYQHSGVRCAHGAARSI